MKKLGIPSSRKLLSLLGTGILIGVVALALSGIAAAIPNQAADVAKEKAKAPDLEKIEFIHWKKDFAKPGTAAAKVPTCYKFLTRTNIKWTTLPVNYEINPTNPQGLGIDFITSAVSNSAETWDTAVTGKELMNDVYIIDDTATYGVQNYENAITFGNYPTKGVIAVTTIWYNPATKAIVEFDVMFDTDWTWGDASVDATKMDLQNIATHELGHGVGLGDVYDSVCSEVTMYGYSNYGEVKKRDLATPDITGLQTLYGN